MSPRLGEPSEPEVAAADPLALDPLGPIVSRPRRDVVLRPDPLALEPLGPIGRFRYRTRPTAFTPNQERGTT
jgi:hypothetical protein